MTVPLESLFFEFPLAAALPSVGSPALWIGFTAFVLVMLALDLFVFHRSAHAVGMREALKWSIVWVTLALLFCVGIYFYFGDRGPVLALEFLTGYVVEKALSVDNLFVFLVIFAYFRVPAALQHRVLFWGILGALIMRAIFIVLGAVLIKEFSWILFVFGGFLLLTGLKMLFSGSDDQVHPERNPVVRLFQRFVPMVGQYHGSRFFVTENARRYATPLLLVLVTVEATDVVFAVDSIPAVFGITTDPFIVYTSNIFAILGLRALFFMLAGMMGKFHYLKIGLSLVLIFVGAKMLLDRADIFHMPILLSLGVIAGLLALSVTASLLWPAPEPLPQPPPEGATPQPAGEPAPPKA